MSRGDRARQTLLLGPGVALVTTGLLSLFRDLTVVGWSVFIIGLALLLTFTRATQRNRSRATATANEADGSRP